MQRLLLMLILVCAAMLAACSSTKPTTSTTVLPELATTENTAASINPDANGIALLSVKCLPSNDEQKQLLHLQLSKKEEDKLSLFFSSKSLAIACEQKPLLTTVKLPIGIYRINDWTLAKTKPQHLLKPFYFSIKAEQVTYLGQLVVEHDDQGDHFSITQDVAKTDIENMQEHYSQYKALPVRRAVL